MSKSPESLDNPFLNDNRLYDFRNEDFYIREEFPIINNWIKNKTKNIDLGCGNGSLMKYLKEQKNIEIEGIEISQSGVDFCLKNELIAKRGEIDKQETYNCFSNQQFDYAICNVTLQMLLFPEIFIKEMTRISKYQIISFPNFAYFENRLDLLFNGVMPRPMLHKYSWFNTGHIHQLSIKDFKSFCKKNGLQIIKREDFGCFSFISRWFWPNFFSKESIFLCKKYDI
jgi:methionine biosynthesis protein MetW